MDANQEYEYKCKKLRHIAFVFALAIVCFSLVTCAGDAKRIDCVKQENTDQHLRQNYDKPWL